MTHNKPKLGKVPLDHTRILFDLQEMKVGCVLLQAAMGGDSAVVNRIDTKHWLLHPTPNMKLYTITPEQIGQLVAKMDSIR